MKKISCNRCVIFAFGLILGAVLMLVLTFAIPGRRTYVGRYMESGKEEIELTRGVGIEMAPVTGVKEEIEKTTERPRRLTFERRLPIRREPEELPTKEIVHEEITAETETPVPEEQAEVTKAETREFEMIPHDHIPMKWEYKMKE